MAAGCRPVQPGPVILSPPRDDVLVGVSVSASSAGLLLHCRHCREYEVHPDVAAADAVLRAFLDRHLAGCSG